jgi:hypothetical protein
MPNGHAKLPPSSAKRWILCGGSVQLCASVVDTGSVYADAGTAGHEVFAACLSGEMKPAAFVGKKASNGFEITEELAEHVVTALEFVEEFREAHPNAAIFSEEKYEIGEGLGLEPGILWGTADFTALCTVELVIADLKLGFVDVEVDDNDQLILYGLGAMDKTGWIFDRLRLVILQPKKNLRPKEIVYTREQMEGFAEQMKTAALAALDPHAPLKPSKPACQFCKAAGVCPELRKEMLALAKREFSSLVTMSGEQIGEILTQAKMIEGAIKSVRSHALKLLEIDPQHIPGWKRVLGEKKRRWKDEQIAQEHFGKSLPLDVIAPRKLVSPLQVETNFAAGIHGLAKASGKKMTKKAAMEEAQKIVEQYAEKPEGEPTLVPEDDKRAALAPVFTEEEVKQLTADVDNARALEDGLALNKEMAEKIIEENGGVPAKKAVIEIKKEEMFD